MYNVTRETIEQSLSIIEILNTRLFDHIAEKDAVLMARVEQNVELVSLQNKVDVYRDAVAVFKSRHTKAMKTAGVLRPAASALNTRKRKLPTSSVEFAEPSALPPFKPTKKSKVDENSRSPSFCFSLVIAVGTENYSEFLQAAPPRALHASWLGVLNEYFTSEEFKPLLGNTALLLLDRREEQEAVIRTAEETVEGINAELEEQDAALNAEINRLNALIFQADADVQKAKTRRAKGEREIENKRQEAEEIMTQIEDIIGKEEMQKWKATLGDEKKNKPALPQRMHGVTGNAIKAYIGGPVGPSQDGQGLIVAGGASGSGGGERDEVPVACEIGAGGM
ncbi:hypothetical protein B0H13DRAFT_1874308 [Mycena leptocephala]|nr:hypothetical protein B0H13DRAFT_1874308 [Mycena leptocephala]